MTEHPDCTCDLRDARWDPITLRCRTCGGWTWDSRQREAVERRKVACCKGTGEVSDLTDSGSGSTCYCDCAAGRALRDADRKRDAERRAALRG